MATKQLWIVSWIKKYQKDGQERSFFDRVGRAYQNKDGSFNFWLEKVPTGLGPETTFHIAPERPREKSEDGGFEE